MRHTRTLTLFIGLFLLCACAMFEAKQPTPPPVVPDKLAVPVGKNWQIVEEAPTLTNERDSRLPFQTEQSVQPEGAQPPPSDQRRIEPPR